jgi:ribosomal protein S18 acetylase RimI-like enzyme
MAEQEISTLTWQESIQPMVRPATKNDLLAMEWNGEFRHFRALYTNAFTRMQEGKSMIWVADSALFGLIGQVFVQMVCDRPELADGWQRAYLYSFRIKPEFRNHGLGTRIMNVVEDFLIDRKFTRLTLNVARDNPSALRLYKRQGFQIVAEEPGIWSYPDDSGVWHTMHEPSWRMEKILKSAVGQLISKSA